MTAAEHALDYDVVGMASADRRLFVVWQDAVSRTYHPVGAAEVGADGNWHFRYLAAVNELPRFHPLTAFPSLDAEYVTASLPPFFANRLMSPSRPSYQQFLATLGLAVPPYDPLEELTRTGGSRATDDLHLFAEPVVDADGALSLHFFVHGLRYVNHVDDLVDSLENGQRLQLVGEPDNPIDERALLVACDTGARIGYVPAWLVTLVEQVAAADSSSALAVEQINDVTAGPNLRVLCRLDAQVGEAFRPFDGPEFAYR